MSDPNALPLPALFRRLTADGSLARLLAAARAEDLGLAGDVTSASMRRGTMPARAAIVARERGTIAGLAAVPAVLGAFAPAATVELHAADGDGVEAGRDLGIVSGPRDEILVAERTLLNLLGHLSGIATATRRAVDAVAGTGASVCDTRKTVPGLRHLAKYAVRCGGGTLHRLGLHDAALYKDNHLAGIAPGDLAAALAPAIRRARSVRGVAFVEVEVDTLEQLRAVLGLPPGLVDIVLLDNMAPGVLREAVAIRDDARPEIGLEASGGITDATIRAVAETGVDRISVGALTHSVRAMDVALDVRS